MFSRAKRLLMCAENRFEAADDERVEVVVERVAEGRRKDDRAARRGLVVVVDDLRQPAPVEDAADVARLGVVVGVVVAVVVVADVALVEHGDATDSLGRHVGVGDQLHAVGVGRADEEDHAIEDATRFLVVLGHHAPDELDDVLRRDALGCVHAGIDPNDGLALTREPLGFVGVDPARATQPLADLAILLALLEVGWRTDDRHPVRLPVRRGADAFEHHAVRLLGELLPIALELRVVREEVVRADLLAEEVLGRGQFGLSGQRRREQGRSREESDGRESRHARILRGRGSSAVDLELASFDERAFGFDQPSGSLAIDVGELGRIAHETWLGRRLAREVWLRQPHCARGVARGSVEGWRRPARSAKAQAPWHVDDGAGGQDGDADQDLLRLRGQHVADHDEGRDARVGPGR